MRKERLNLEVEPAVRRRIERLQRLSEASNMTEVIRRAVAAYEVLLDETMKGSRILIEPVGEVADGAVQVLRIV